VSLKSSDEDANQFYDDYVYFCDDIIEGLEKYFKGLPPKKTYEELIKALSQKIAPHFLFVIQQVHRKLKSLSNIDGTSAEAVCEQATTTADLSSGQETEVCA
jgi:hypothetical protein